MLAATVLSPRSVLPKLTFVFPPGRKGLELLLGWPEDWSRAPSAGLPISEFPLQGLMLAATVLWPCFRPTVQIQPHA